MFSNSTQSSFGICHSREWFSAIFECKKVQNLIIKWQNILLKSITNMLMQEWFKTDKFITSFVRLIIYFKLSKIVKFVVLLELQVHISLLIPNTTTVLNIN